MEYLYYELSLSDLQISIVVSIISEPVSMELCSSIGGLQFLFVEFYCIIIFSKTNLILNFSSYLSLILWLEF